MQFIATQTQNQEKDKFEEFKASRRQCLEKGDNEGYKKIVGDAMRFEETVHNKVMAEVITILDIPTEQFRKTHEKLASDENF
jgi:3-deoxy-D-manno-octulosonic acid (KDO) 8-phosphate synthase